MSIVSHKTIHSMAMVGLEKTIDTNGWNLKTHWKTIGTNGSHVKNHWKTIDYNGTLTKTINHSIVVKFLPSFRSISIMSHSSLSSSPNSLTFSLSSLTRKTLRPRWSICEFHSLSVHPFVVSSVTFLQCQPYSHHCLCASNNYLKMPCCPGAVPMDPTAPPFPGYAWKNKVPAVHCDHDLVFDHDSHVQSYFCKQCHSGCRRNCWRYGRL